MRHPQVRLIEEVLREGVQIESPTITLEDKLALLDLLSRSGLETIVVGSFVSPRWVPQMSRIDELVERLRPVEGVEYRALALNAKGRERRAAHSPPLTDPTGAERHQLKVHLCDVFVRRNTNRSQHDEIAAWDAVVERAVAEDAQEASISVNAAWGSNWSGEFSSAQRMELLEAQHRRWDAVGIPVTRVWLGDPMGWNLPPVVADQVREVVTRWPAVTTVHLHLHDTRGLALSSALAAIDALPADRTLVLDTSVGGIGGCPYCGNGRATGMIATEDLVHVLERMGIRTGIDLGVLIEAAVMVERLIGRPVNGRVAKAGPCPVDEADRYPLDLPLIATFEEAAHFRLGSVAHGVGVRPWQRPEPSDPAPGGGSPGRPPRRPAGTSQASRSQPLQKRGAQT